MKCNIRYQKQQSLQDITNDKQQTPSPSAEDVRAEEEKENNPPKFNIEHEKKTMVATAATASTVNSSPRAATAGTTTKTKTPENADESSKFLHAQFNLQEAPSQMTATTTPPSTLTYPTNTQPTFMQIFAQNARRLEHQVFKMKTALYEMQQLIDFNTMLFNLPISPLTPPPTPAPMMMAPPQHYHIVHNQQAIRAQQQTIRQQEAMANFMAPLTPTFSPTTTNRQAMFDLSNAQNSMQFQQVNARQMMGMGVPSRMPTMPGPSAPMKMQQFTYYPMAQNQQVSLANPHAMTQQEVAMSAEANQKHAGTEPMEESTSEQNNHNDKEKSKETAEESKVPTILPRHLSPNSDYPHSSSDLSSSSLDSERVSTKKRTTRLTRLMDYQIKYLEQFFEENRYPLSQDLEYLSDWLSLSPRVIIFWFRTARQQARRKAKKLRKNQPAVEPIFDVAHPNRSQRTPELNDCNSRKDLSDQPSCSKNADDKPSCAKLVIVLSSEVSSYSSTNEEIVEQPIQSPPYTGYYSPLTPSTTPT